LTPAGPTAPDRPGRGPRLVLLSTSPRVAPGLLTADAWAELAAASSVAAAEGHPLTPYVEAQGTVVRREAGADVRSLAARLVEDAAAGTAVWLVGRDGDPELGRALAELVATGTPLELEMLPASYDLPGAAVLDLVATMDRLRSPGGCPWDAEQTHESLTTYLLEETYETLEAIETGDRHHLREELGDLLLQVVFHSRIAEEHPEDAWSVDDVASDIVAKLVRRHPHVFGSDGGQGVTTAADVEAGWHARKAAEKGRESAVEGVPTALPALALAAKLMHRAASHGVAVPPGDDDGLGSQLMELVAAAQAEGVDAEAELRAAARRFSDRVRLAEQAAAAEGPPG
jgi:XTP/dITP diphosphohydrolase